MKNKENNNTFYKKCYEIKYQNCETPKFQETDVLKSRDSVKNQEILNQS
jgi:hypothetical protein